MKKPVFDEYMEYWNSVIPELVEAENTVKRIKDSKQWKRVSNYFKVLYQRGFLAVNPCKENNYSIIKNQGVISLEELKDILTPEQMKEVLRRKEGKTK